MASRGPQGLEQTGRRTTRRRESGESGLTAARRAMRLPAAVPRTTAPPPSTTQTTQKGAIVPLWRRFPIVLGVATGIGLCAIALMLSLLLTHIQPAPPDPAPIARALCADLQSQDYAATYALLSTRLRSEGTATQFAASQRRLDIQRGQVTSCTPTVQHADAAQATVSLTLARGATAAQTASVTLIYETGAWAIDAYDPALV